VNLDTPALVRPAAILGLGNEDIVVRSDRFHWPSWSAVEGRALMSSFNRPRALAGFTGCVIIFSCNYVAFSWNCASSGRYRDGVTFGETPEPLSGSLRALNLIPIPLIR